MSITAFPVPPFEAARIGAPPASVLAAIEEARAACNAWPITAEPQVGIEPIEVLVCAMVERPAYAAWMLRSQGGHEALAVTGVVVSTVLLLLLGALWLARLIWRRFGLGGDGRVL